MRGRGIPTSSLLMALLWCMTAVTSPYFFAAVDGFLGGGAAYFSSSCTTTRRAICRTSGGAKREHWRMMAAKKGFGQRSSPSGEKGKPSPSLEAKGKGQQKGFGATAAGEVSSKASSSKKRSRSSVAASMDNNRPQAGAAIQEGVVRQTEEAIRRSMDDLRTTRPDVWEALELRKTLAMWQSQTASLNVLQLAGLPPRQVQHMKAVEAQLEKLQEEHGISDRLLHNIAQEATWDASARVKDQRQANVQLPPSAVEHMQALVARSGAGCDSRVMDVGAGTGILLRFLQDAGVAQENFVGVDLSAGMVEVAGERYPGATFVQGDFLDYRSIGSSSDVGRNGFTHVFFNGCLHNFLEPGAALARAAELLREGGKIVISHPKGAANVDKQRRANPILVPNRLPTEQDLEKSCQAIPALANVGMRVVQDGPESGVRRSGAGYLQVLQRAC